MSEQRRSVAERVEELLGQMTLAEKVGQLNLPIPFPPEAVALLEDDGIPGTVPTTLDDCKRLVEGSFNQDIGPVCGFWLLGSFQPANDARELAEVHNRLQESALRTRLGIPLLQVDESIHGVLVMGATVFPEGIALGSSWDLTLFEEVFVAVAEEATAMGTQGLGTLLAEPIRDPRLGRCAEGFTEDTYLASRLVEAIVRGTHGDDLSAPDKAVAVLSHFPAQSQPTSGMERGSMEISERTLREIFLPPWEAGIRYGALGIMPTYPSIDGVPAHASKWLLTELLRDELGFRGVTFSEGGGFNTIVYEGVAATQKEAGAAGIEAGVDLNITYEDAYLKPLIENVRDGIVPEELIDRAVRRVLELKFRLGLFDSPMVDVERAAEVVNSQEHRDLALQAGREGIVLLKNEGDLLPLSKDLQSVAVIGPNADSLNTLGSWVAMVKPAAQNTMNPLARVVEGIRAKAASPSSIRYAKGCDILGDDRTGFAEAVDAAQAADVAIVVVGEQLGVVWGAAEGEEPTVEEGHDVASLDLTGVQEELVKAVVGTGTPTVVVLINGRPLSVRWIAEHVPAIVEAWLPGERGGEAVADVLFGDHNPSGRLAITIPRHVGQLPCYYNHRRSKAYKIEKEGYHYVDMPATPLWEFGYGLSYTSFEYSGLRIDPEVIGVDGQVRVACEVKNAGQRAGKEVVQLYVRDVVASVAPYDRQLRGFEKVSLEPGETKTVEFSLGFEELKMLDRDLRWVVEPGAFEVLVGASCQDIRLQGSLEVKS